MEVTLHLLTLFTNRNCDNGSFSIFVLSADENAPAKISNNGEAMLG